MGEREMLILMCVISLLQYCTICQIVDLASIGVPGSRQPLLLNADDKSFIFSTGSFIVLAADHHEVLCRSCGREVENFKHIKLRFKILIETSESITIVQWSLVDCWHRSICWDPKPFVDNVQFVGPKLLKPRWQIRLSSKCPLSPQTSFTDRFVNAAINLFTFFKCFFAVSELDIIWVDCEIARGKVEKSSRCSSSPLALLSFTFYRFWVWGGHLWENWLPWGWSLDPWGLLVSRLPLEGLRLPKVQVHISNSIWDRFITEYCH